MISMIMIILVNVMFDCVKQNDFTLKYISNGLFMTKPYVDKQI